MSKFYTDSMLGKLARFLRFFGYDTLYRREETVDEMLTVSSKDNRILLTRSEDIKQKCVKLDVHSVLLFETDVKSQLKELNENSSFEMNIPPSNARCSLCNYELNEIAKQKIIHLIPEGTAEHHDLFWQCTLCGKIYWIGSHWKDIEKIVTEAKIGLGYESRR